MSPAADAQDPAHQDPAPPSGANKDLGERVGAIETEQKEQRGILDRIEQALAGRPGTGSPASPAAAPGPGGSEPSPSIAEQVRRGVEEIEAKRRADAEAAAVAGQEQAWRQGVEQHIAEHRPAPVTTGRRAKLQRWMFGKPDQR